MTGAFPSPESLLPHSHPFVLVDRILEREEGRSIVCLKNVTFNESFIQGHFRNDPVMPGVLIIEAMAQASGLIMDKGDKGASLSRVNDARFRAAVRPGDRMVIKSELVHEFKPLYVFDVRAYVCDEIVSSAEITLAIP